MTGTDGLPQVNDGDDQHPQGKPRIPTAQLFDRQR